MNFTPLASSSAGNAYLLESQGVAPLLLDAGISIKRLRERLWKHGVSLPDLAGCLASHEHQDHCKAIDDLLRAGVDCYMSKGTAEIMGWDGHHRTNVFGRTADGGYRAVDIAAQWVAMPFHLEHDAEEPTGFIVAPYGTKDERLLFIPDTGFVRNKFKGVTILCIECNNLAEKLTANVLNGSVPAPVAHRVRRNHMELGTVINMLKANDLSKCREIHLLHLSDGNSDEARMVRAVQEATGIPTYCAQQ
jgi:phosphoribosyl 1,2-cyclic phosphodiesterase